jgi:predicted ribosomally synthesized peptide with nif11-like leader
MESAVAFYERVEKDVELQEKLKELGTKENVEGYVKGELGYDFTLEEMQKVIFEKNPEMTEEELEAVVGGLNAQDVVVFLGALVTGGVIIAGSAAAGAAA